MLKFLDKMFEIFRLIHYSIARGHLGFCLTPAKPWIICGKVNLLCLKKGSEVQ